MERDARDDRIEELEAQVRAKDARIAELESQVASLAKQMAELAARVNQNSSNSHRPPSSDTPDERRKVTHPRKTS